MRDISLEMIALIGVFGTVIISQIITFVMR